MLIKYIIILRNAASQRFPFKMGLCNRKNCRKWHNNNTHKVKLGQGDGHQRTNVTNLNMIKTIFLSPQHGKDVFLSTIELFLGTTERTVELFQS